MIPDVSGFATSSELNSLKTSVSSGKSLVASAVTGKGVSTAADASFQTIANNINDISTEKTYGTTRIYGSYDANEYYAGRIIYMSAYIEDISLYGNYSVHAGPGFVLITDGDSDWTKAYYRDSTGKLTLSNRVDNTPHVGGGPYTDGTFYAYYSNYYRQYKVTESGLASTGYISKTESDLSDGKAEYTQKSIDFIEAGSYGGSSKVDKSFALKYGRFGSPDPLPILVGDASPSYRRYNGDGTYIVDKHNGFPAFAFIVGNFCPAIYQIDDTGHYIPVGRISTSQINALRNISITQYAEYLLETIYRAKILSNDSSSLLIQNLGPA